MKKPKPKRKPTTKPKPKRGPIPAFIDKMITKGAQR
ncbi:MAG: hypothetical protein OJF50_000955 [Nitrospira sp.]|nr:hypothetical protein [Nitrospira sp.]